MNGAKSVEVWAANIGRIAVWSMLAGLLVATTAQAETGATTVTDELLTRSPGPMPLSPRQ